MSDLIDQEEEHKAEIEAKHTPAPGLDVMKIAGVKKESMSKESIDIYSNVLGSKPLRV
jgi:hypothetical protein